MYLTWVNIYQCLGFRSLSLYMLGDKHSRPKPLSFEEEKFLRVFYEAKLREVCSAFFFPHKIQVCFSISYNHNNHNFFKKKEQWLCCVYRHHSELHVLQATALIYFKRFYLQWSVMQHHPKHIMYDIM